MKKQARFVILQAAEIHPAAAKIFVFTRRTFNLVLVVSLLMLTAAPLCADRDMWRQAGLALCHASFRMAAIGAVTGFAADIVLRQSRGK